MAQNFFKVPNFNGHMSSKSSVVSSASRMDYFGYNRNLAPPMSSCSSNTESSVREIESRLEVLTRITTQEEVSRISEEIIGRLNAVCYEKLAERILPTSAAPSVYAESVRSTALPLNNCSKRGRPKLTKKAVEITLLEAAKKVAEEKRLNTIREEGKKQEFAVPIDRKENLKSRSRKKEKESFVIQNEEDYAIFQKSLGSKSSCVPKFAQSEVKKLQPLKSNSRKRKDVTEIREESDDALELTITVNSLRSRAVQSRKPAKSKNIEAFLEKPMHNDVGMPNPVMKNNENSLDVSAIDSIHPLPSEEFSSAFKIPKGPKKTALSPFLNRNIKRKNPINTSTPMK